MKTLTLRARALRICIVSLAFVILFYAASVSAKPMQQVDASRPLSPAEIDAALEDCAVVQALNAAKAAANQHKSTYIQQLFRILFPGSPAVNALLATLYISGPPNFLLALCPPNINPSSLGVMVAFAVGGLLGDTLFHLLPEIFLGEDEADHARFVLIEPKKNLLLGVAIMVGFMTFVAMDKALRIATGGQGGHDHGHAHSHKDVAADAIDEATTSGSSQSNGSVKARKRSKKTSTNGSVSSSVASPSSEKGTSSSIKIGAYLNLIADFTHNITDGLAMSASFYTSPTIGATTTMAVFFHEIPHEVGDFALLIQSGFSKRAAMGAQFITAVGALLGTCIGIAVQEFGGSSASAAASASASGASSIGILGTTLQIGDLLLPFTAGTFLYVGTVAVIPEMLEVDKTATKAAEFRRMGTQFAAVAAGAGIMLAISW